MKLVYAIVRNDNEDDVVSLLNQNHYSVTRLSTTGGFLKKGEIQPLMIGVEDEKSERGDLPESSRSVDSIRS